ncbi:MAG: flagellar hook capping FlgD N-terminal domain-containing protein [Lachnospiraceae bacterium]|nr:flagellar hook capping FlgD N-terminal domain-containing protein [Lachnospiraceae bacterium]
MAIIAPVDEDGKLITDLSTTKKTNSSTTGSNSLGKDDFLQLLVAQMKYQDPLEPTSNTEYISQYATFSELEQMQNMSASIDLDRASGLVGKSVYMKSTNATTGVTSYFYGKVDFVQYENGSAFLSINGGLYPLEDLDSVVDQDYMDAYEKAQALVNDIEKLPSVDNVTIEDADAITAISETFNKMSSYEQSFFDPSVKTTIQSYVDRLAEVKKVAETAANEMVENLKNALKELPALEELTLENEKAVNAANKIYKDMNKFQQGYVTEETKTALDNYVAKIEELKKESGETTEDV